MIRITWSVSVLQLHISIGCGVSMCADGFPFSPCLHQVVLTWYQWYLLLLAYHTI